MRSIVCLLGGLLIPLAASAAKAADELDAGPADRHQPAESRLDRQVVLVAVTVDDYQLPPVQNAAPTWGRAPLA
jgi:hypothetical protein